MPNISALSQVTRKIAAITTSLKIIAISQVTRTTVGMMLIPGPAGPASDKNYVHDQMIASATWTVNHNLGKYPAIMIVDSSGNVVEGCIQEVSTTQAILTFTSAFAGHAYCN